MKLNKSILSCAIAIAMGSSFAVHASTADKNVSTSPLSAQVSIQSDSNSITLEQVLNNNTAALKQDGDSNTMIIETVGENNTNEVTQLQFVK